MHRALTLIFTGLVLLSSLTRVFAATNAKKDVVAITNVEMAITALGGDAAVLTIKDSVIKGSMAPAAGSWVKPASFLWETSGPEFRSELTRDSGTQIFVSGHGTPAVSRNGVVSALFYHVSLCAPSLQLPALVLSGKETDPNSSLIDAGKGTTAGKNAVEVQTSSIQSDQIAAITQQTWYIDSSTGLPLRVEFRVPQATDMTQWTNASVDFSDFRKAGDLLVPYSMTYSEEGVALEVFTVSTVDFNVGLPASDFDLLGGGK